MKGLGLDKVKHTIAALMPLKGHSERVPGKNLRPLAGKSLYRWMVDTLLAVDEIGEILIDTDSQEIIKDIEKYYPNSKVITFERPEYLLGDFVTMNTLIEYDITRTKADTFFQTHATNPLLKAETIRKAIKAFVDDDEHDSLFTVNRLQTRLYCSDGRALNHNPKKLIRTQDLDPVYEENSNGYLFTRESFAAAGNKRIGLKSMMLEMNTLESIDIDEESDFVFAETIVSLERGNK